MASDDKKYTKYIFKDNVFPYLSGTTSYQGFNNTTQQK